jgi:hypothetical protein
MPIIQSLVHNPAQVLDAPSKIDLRYVPKLYDRENALGG